MFKSLGRPVLCCSCIFLRCRGTYHARKMIYATEGDSPCQVRSYMTYNAGKIICYVSNSNDAMKGDDPINTTHKVTVYVGSMTYTLGQVTLTYHTMEGDLPCHGGWLTMPWRVTFHAMEGDLPCHGGWLTMPWTVTYHAMDGDLPCHGGWLTMPWRVTFHAMEGNFPCHGG